MDKAILLTIDGFRPEAMSAAPTPNIQKLMATGCHTLQARSFDSPVPFAAPRSTVSSLLPEPDPSPRDGAPVCEYGIADYVRRAGKSCAAFLNWSPDHEPAETDAWDHMLSIHNSQTRNGDVVNAAEAADYIREKHPDFCFIYLGCLHDAAQGHGFLSDEYFKALIRADFAVGVLMGELHTLDGGEDYTLLVQSGHGGFGKEPFAPAGAMAVPWIASGRPIRSNHQIQASVSVLDTAPTLARILNLEPLGCWPGKVVEEIFR